MSKILTTGGKLKDWTNLYYVYAFEKNFIGKLGFWKNSVLLSKKGSLRLILFISFEF